MAAIVGSQGDTKMATNTPELSRKFHVTYLPNLTTSSSDAIELQQINDRDEVTTLRAVINRCRRFRVEARLQNAGGIPKGRVYADGEWRLS
jgi:hypothetical protein